jgi:hypothetical protein
MSSATSIEKLGRAAKPRAGQQPQQKVDDGFRPWHFFVLASLMAATVAVVMAKQATPEHLILLSFTIAAAGLAAAAFYRTIAPLATDDVSLYTEPMTDRTRTTLEREKALTLRAIKELEFDRAMGKVSENDFEEMVGRLRARAISIMKQLDDDSSVYRELIERELRARVGQQK